MENIIYKTGKECLGKDMSKTQGEFGCVEAVSAVFYKAIGQELGENLSTSKLYRSLLKDTRFKRVTEPRLGDIIISPTDYGQGYGHTGIVSDSGKILSNNSKNSLWDEHLSIGEWRLKYKTFPIALFRFQFPAENVMIVSDIEQKKISILQKIIELYKQIISQLSVNKLGSKNMSSKLFRINLGDLGRGILVAVLSTVFLAFGTALSAENFSFASFDYASLLQVAMASGMAYVVKNFVTSEQGNLLGMADK